MGIYLFNTSDIIHELKADACRSSAHDFSRNMLPEMMKSGRIFAHEFIDKNKEEPKYWRDVGEIDAYWEASMDLVAVDPHFNLYHGEWPMGGLVIPKGSDVR